MKLPRTPPALEILLKKHAQVFSTQAFTLAAASPMALGKYRHWDKVRRIEPPDGLNHEQWWMALKMARAAGRKFLGLREASGRKFSFIVPDEGMRLLQKISMELAGRGALPEAFQAANSQDQFIQNALIEESITSSQLEGAATTRRVAQNMLRSNRKPRDHGERMIVNNFNTMQHLHSSPADKLTPAAILKIHRLVTEGTLPDESAAGRMRFASEDIVVVNNVSQEVIHRPPPANDLPQLMDDLCSFANDDTDDFIHPIARSILLHFWLSYIHPFVDGNGRTARALFYWSMKRRAFSICEYISISSIIHNAPMKYARAFLYTESDDADATYFFMYHLDVINGAFQRLISNNEQKQRIAATLRSELSGLTDLNRRQQEVVMHSLNHPLFEYSVQSHQRSHKVVYQTARTDLLNLVKRGYLIQRKLGNKFIFTPAPNLRELLT